MDYGKIYSIYIACFMTDTIPSIDITPNLEADTNGSIAVWTTNGDDELHPLPRINEPIIAKQGLVHKKGAILPRSYSLSPSNYGRGRLVVGRVSGDGYLPGVEPEDYERFGFSIELVEQFSRLAIGGVLRDAGLSQQHLEYLAAIAERQLIHHIGSFQLPLYNNSSNYTHEYQDTRSRRELTTILERELLKTAGGKKLRIADFGTSSGMGILGVLASLQERGLISPYRGELEVVLIDKIIQGREIIDHGKGPKPLLKGQKVINLQGDLALPKELDNALIASGEMPLVNSCDLVTIFDMLHVATFPAEVFNTAWDSLVDGGKILLGGAFDNFPIYKLKENIDEAKLNSLLDATHTFGELMQRLSSKTGVESVGEEFVKVLTPMLENPEELSEFLRSYRSEGKTQELVKELIETKNYYQLGLLSERIQLYKLMDLGDACYDKITLVEHLRNQGVQVNVIPKIEDWKDYVKFCIIRNLNDVKSLGIGQDDSIDQIPEEILQTWHREYLQGIPSSQVAYYEIIKSDSIVKPLADAHVEGFAAEDFHADHHPIVKARYCVG